jgi:hypothetical protein
MLVVRFADRMRQRELLLKGEFFIVWVKYSWPG